jgi:hypothetical protein
VADARAHGEKEAQARFDVQPALVAITIYVLPFDVLHDDVGEAIVGRAAVEQSRDVRVVERGERASFVMKPAQDEVGIHSALHHLHRDQFAEVALSALGQINRAHAAAPQLAHDVIRADARAALKAVRGGVYISRPQRREFVAGDLSQVHGGLFEKFVRGLVTLDQTFDFTAQNLVARSRFRQKPLSFFRRDVESRLENGFDAPPAFGRHHLANWHPDSCSTRT